MNRRSVRSAAVGVSLALALTTALPTFAHGGRGGIAGTVTNVSGTSLQVQTQSGTATVQLAATTRVIRFTSGSVADLKPGAAVRLQVATGSTTVTAINIAPARGTFAQRPAGASGTASVTRKTPTTRTPRTTSTRTPGTARTRSLRSGQVVQVNGTALTLRGRRGQTATYTLGTNVTVTKTVAGQLSDLKVGQTVRVLARGAGSTAAAVIIEKG